ncbi:MAG: SusC/RagA family TonB-linked outer membrane protein [Saprospiraceae bacterium]
MKFKFDFLAKCLLLLLVAMGMSSLAMAQRTISGTVTDAETGDPLIGANILAVGTSTGTITDIDGTYSLQLPDGITELEVSYTGYTAKRVALGVSNVVDVALSAGSVLDEVVVIGYGTAKKSDLTGSVASLGEDDFNQGLVTSPDQLLQGRAAGVQIVNNSGQPGGAATIRIRGNSSIRAGNSPLFVVDGVQLTGSSTKPGTNAGDLGSTAGSNPLNYINPADIESIQVLKDASAAAIYGSRGANGVVLITTKKGRSGDPTINFSTSAGYSSILKKYDVLNGDEYRAALQQYNQSGGDYGDNVDAMDEILRNGLVQNHNISISGGNNNGTYRASIGYYDQKGIVKSNDLRRLTANLSGSYKFLDSRRFGLDYNLIASQTSENGPPVSTNAGFRGSLIGNALQWNPTHKLYEADGSPVIVPEFGNFTNPVALLQAYHDKSNTVDIIGSISPSYKITDNLTYRFDYSITHGVGERRTRIASWINMQDVEGRGLASINERNMTNQILTHTLNYNQNLSSDLSLQAVVGYEYQKRTEKNFGLSARDFLVQDFDYTNIFQNSSPDSRDVFSGSPPDEELQSYFARANFNFQNKYLLTASFRADGSSKFGANNQYGYFPAFAFAWNLHNEDFLSGGAFDNLKLRLGWGQTGNSEFEAGASQERWRFGQGSIQQENVANPDLQWETTTNYNIGLDFAVLDYKLTGTIEYFNRSSEDLLFQANAIPPAPAVLYWINLPGKVVNSGVELTLNTELVNNENLTWNLGANVSFLSNELQDYNGANLEYGQLFGQGISAATIMRLQDGQPLNSFYMAEFVNIGEDGQSVLANNGDKAYVGDPNPDILLGVTSSLSAGNFSLNLNFNGAFGHDIYNNTKNTVIPIGNLGTRNIDASLLNSANQEAISNPIAPSSRYIEKGDYLKLANATLSYNIGSLGNTVKDARIYITGTNLFVITDYSGFDPEVNTVNQLNGLPSFGIEYIPYPSARTIMLGANFSF